MPTSARRRPALEPSDRADARVAIRDCREHAVVYASELTNDLELASRGCDVLVLHGAMQGLVIDLDGPADRSAQ